jgi:hypothetical protein
VHPPGMDYGSLRAKRDVLTDAREVRTLLTGSLGQRKLTGKLMLQNILFSHQQRVLARCFG